MATMTLTARIIRYMLAMGYTEVLDARTKKYRVFKPSALVLKDNPNRRYFVGPAGAVRSSNDGIVSKSFDVAGTFTKFVRAYEDENNL